MTVLIRDVIRKHGVLTLRLCFIAAYRMWSTSAQSGLATVAGLCRPVSPQRLLR